MQDFFKLIGIRIRDSKPDWAVIMDYEPSYNGIFGPIGYSTSYLNPHSILNPMFALDAWGNLGEINDTRLNDLMALALETTDDTIRNTIYKNIQGYIAEEGYFHIPLYHSKLFFVHSADLRGVPYNAMGEFRAHGIWRI
jgi:ABC-type transport system substrate-binding protein